MPKPCFAGVIEDYPQLRLRHLRGEDLDELDAAGFEGYYTGPASVVLDKDGKPFAELRLGLVPFNAVVRPWMFCPRCGARRGVLVLHPSGVGCRGKGCLNLTWRSTRQTSQERRELRQEYLADLLLDEDGQYRRPAGMRVKTFDALADELEWLEFGG